MQNAALQLTEQAGIAVVAIAAIVCQVTGGALLLRRFLPISLSNIYSEFAVWGACGFTVASFLMLLLGYLHCLSPLPIGCITLISGIYSISRLSQFPKFAAATPKSKFALVMLVLSVAMLVLVLGSGFRPPFAADELDYHYAGPVMWAKSGGWYHLNCKFVNGPAMMEWLYTCGAVFGSSTAAHWTHTLTLLLLVCGCGALTSIISGNSIAAIAACLGAPVIVNQAPICYNDVAMAAFLISAYVVLLDVPRLDEKENENLRNRLIVSGLLFGTAYLVKSLALAAIPVAWFIGTRKGLFKWRDHAAFILPIVILVLVGTIHTYFQTGALSDPTRKPVIGTIPANPDYGAAVYLARDPEDPMLLNGCTAGRIPTAKDLLTLPAVPFLTGFLGQKEPYGGRIGLIIPFFLPFLFWRMRSFFNLKSETKEKVQFMLLAASSYFVLVAPIFIKTRFHIFVWVLLLVLICSIALPARGLRYRALFVLLIVLGMADSAHSLVFMPKHSDAIGAGPTKNLPTSPM